VAVFLHHGGLYPHRLHLCGECGVNAASFFPGSKPALIVAVLAIIWSVAGLNIFFGFGKTPGSPS